MPLYAFRCPRCGSFEQRRAVAQATEQCPCPACGTPARRRFTVPGVTTAAGPLASASARDKARFDRAQSGEPTVTGPPPGRPLHHRDSHHH